MSVTKMSQRGIAEVRNCLEPFKIGAGNEIRTRGLNLGKDGRTPSARINKGLQPTTTVHNPTIYSPSQGSCVTRMSQGFQRLLNRYTPSPASLYSCGVLAKSDKSWVND